MGAGAFKTAHTVTLVLLVPTTSGIGSCAHETIIIKCPYTHHPGQFNEGPFKCLGVREESEKLFCKANVLYWVKALFKLTEDFIAKRIVRVQDPPPFMIPSVCFVNAALAFQYPPGPARGPRALVIDCAYLCEEEIEDAEMSFIKLTHNSNCVPLLKPGELGYEVAQFLTFTQHIQYLKMKGSAYVSDYQGMYLDQSTKLSSPTWTGTMSLLTDSQILTHL